MSDKTRDVSRKQRDKDRRRENTEWDQFHSLTRRVLSVPKSALGKRGKEAAT